jgi:hypothetical protein
MARPVDFPGSNIVFAKDQPQYLPLPAYLSNDHEGRVTSCWALSVRERLRLLFTGRVWLTVWTFQARLQPQRLGVDRPSGCVRGVDGAAGMEKLR